MAFKLPTTDQVRALGAEMGMEITDKYAQSFINYIAPFAEGYFEATVSATVTAKVGDKTLFLAEAAQAGIFSLRGIPADDLAPLLGIACPNILYPYVRETISDLVTRGGFPPVLLAPVSFEALYAQRAQAEAGQPRVEIAS